MEQNQRTVGAFMLAGLALAVVVGVLVWNASTPDRTVTAGYTSNSPAPVVAQTSSASGESGPSSRKSESPQPRSSRPPRPADAGQAQHANQYGAGGSDVALAPQANSSYRMEADPYAPPLAVTSAPRSVAPTAVYRPTNVRPPSQEQPSRAGAPETPGVPGATNTPVAPSRVPEPESTVLEPQTTPPSSTKSVPCLLYTSDAADE